MDQKRLECSYLLKKQNAAIDSITVYVSDEPNNILNLYRIIDSVALKGLTILQQYSDDIPEDQYLLIKSNFISRCQSIKYSKVREGLWGFKQSDYFLALRNYYDPVMAKVSIEELNKNPVLQRSIAWLQFIISNSYANHYLYTHCFKTGTAFNFKYCYQYIINNFTSFTRSG